MQKSYLIATIAAMASAFKTDGSGSKPGDDFDTHIVFPDGSIPDVRVDPNLYPAVFKWPNNSPRCGATMVSKRVALTAAHCVREAENINGGLSMPIRLTDGNNNYQDYKIVDIRANECWFSGGNPHNHGRYSSDIAILILDRDITPAGGAIEGKHYYKPW